MSFRARPSTANQLENMLSTAWRNFHDAICGRIEVMEQAIAAMGYGIAQPELESRALRAAHNLAGELGTFGYPRASKIAAEAAAILLDPSRRSSSDLWGLSRLMESLKLELCAISLHFDRIQKDRGLKRRSQLRPKPN